MRLDLSRSRCPPPPVSIVVVPEDFEHRKSILDWALQNLAENGERLVIVVHVQTSPNKVEEKLREYVAMRYERKVVKYEALLIKDADVVEGLRKHIELKDITNLVAHDELYSDKMWETNKKLFNFNLTSGTIPYYMITKSLNSDTASQPMQTEAPPCKIWFIACNRDLISTSYLPRSIADSWIRRILKMSGNNHRLSSAHKLENNTGADAVIYDFASFLEMVKRTKEEYEGEFQKKKSDQKKQVAKEKSPSKVKSPSRYLKGKDKEKSCQRELQDEMSHLRKKIQEMETAIEFLNKQIARNEYFLQEPEASVTEAGGLGEENNDQQSALLTLPAETTVNNEFSKDEIEESKECSGNTLIGSGSSSVVYKGLLHNTTHVAIKMLHGESVQGESDFNRKAGVLGRVRHPNLVTLIGVCREVLGLVYEFLPNGSLQDELVAWRNGRMAPLKWQVRIKIIRQIWTVLTFLHSSKQPLVHGNLKASKVLLDLQDSNFACKVEAFGISQSSNGGTSITGEPTATKDDDVRSFGTIALQLLMARLSPEKDAVKVVDEAKEKGELELDADLNITAWDWPPEVAKRLAHVGLRCVCVGMRSPEAPDDDDDLAEEVRQLFAAADRLAAASQEEAEAQAPRQFYCPLSQDLMVDPHIAADAQTYEGDYIKTCFSYRNISPVTKETFSDKKLIRNQALKSLIEDWKEAQQWQVRTTLIVSDPNPPTPTGLLHPDPPSVTSSSLTPLDDTSAAEAQLELQPPPASSSPPTTLISSSTADARSRSTSIRRRHVNGRLPSSWTEAADVPGPRRD